VVCDHATVNMFARSYINASSILRSLESSLSLAVSLVYSLKNRERNSVDNARSRLI